MKNYRKDVLKNKKGITLIALVVTIIILLILAGISIAMLTGNNGILQKAADAKKITGIAEIVENAKLDVLAQISENKGENITKDQLKKILNIYFEDIDTLEIPDDLSNSDIKLNANQTYGGYQNIELSKIYNGKVGDNYTPTVSKKIGDTVSYTTSMNGVTLSNWKVFYTDEDYITLILADYMPSSAIGFRNPTLSFGGSIYGMNPSSETNRMGFLDVLQTKANWSSLLKGTVNGMPIDYSDTTDINIWAMGAPTLDLWVNSWNMKYPEDTIYIATTEDEMFDGLKGYYIGLVENPTTTSIDYQVMQSKEGYNNTLYYPHHEWIESCYAYWLASPSAYESPYSYRGRIYDVSFLQWIYFC